MNIAYSRMWSSVFSIGKQNDNICVAVSAQILPREKVIGLLNSMVQSGREYSKKHRSPCPLMYAYYDVEYLGEYPSKAGLVAQGSVAIGCEGDVSVGDKYHRLMPSGAWKVDRQQQRIMCQ